MERANLLQRASELSRGGSPSPTAAWALLLLQEATGDSESDDLPAAAGGSLSAFDADDGDAESCSGSGGEDDGMELDVGRRIVSWESWMLETAIAARQDGACPLSSTGDAAAGDAESDRLFWEACIAHGY